MEENREPTDAEAKLLAALNDETPKPPPGMRIRTRRTNSKVPHWASGRAKFFRMGPNGNS